VGNGRLLDDDAVDWALQADGDGKGVLLLPEHVTGTQVLTVLESPIYGE
jgi:hypothetical protein